MRALLQGATPDESPRLPIVVGGLALSKGVAALGVFPNFTVVVIAIAVDSASHLVLDVFLARIRRRVVRDSVLGRGPGSS
ncbi:MAG: hypothetical protein HY264_02820 [Chloroflexi bacterium]|nr:hypothetical protein [Chloroflexota bacterium]